MERRSKQIFIQRRQMTKNHMKRCSTYNYQRNANQNYHLAPVRMTIIKESTNNKCWRGYGEKGMLLCSSWECKLVQPLWRIVQRFLNKLNIGLTYDPAVPFLSIYPEKTITQKCTCTPMLIAAAYIRAKTWKQPKCPSSEEWIMKLWYIYTMKYYSAIKKN